jgi:hypothetical protein
MPDPRISIGRIVHFKPASQDTSPAHGADVYPGIVTGVYDDAGLADVCTFGQRSLYYQVKVAQLDPERPEAGGWFWPPRAA